MRNPYIDAFDLAVPRTLRDEKTTRRVTFASGDVVTLDELLDRLGQEYGSERCPPAADFLLNEDAGSPLTIAEAVSRFRGRLKARDIRGFDISESERVDVMSDLALEVRSHKAVPRRVQVRMSFFPVDSFLARFEDDATTLRSDTAEVLGLRSPASVAMGVKALRRIMAGGV